MAFTIPKINIPELTDKLKKKISTLPMPKSSASIPYLTSNPNDNPQAFGPNPKKVTPPISSIFNFNDPRYSNVKDLAQGPSLGLGKFYIEPAYNIVSSVKELVTGNPLPKLKIPGLTENIPSFVDSSSYQQKYNEAIEIRKQSRENALEWVNMGDTSEVPLELLAQYEKEALKTDAEIEKDAYKQTFLGGLMDSIMVAPVIKTGIKSIIPKSSFIKSEINTISKDALYDYFSGRKTASQLGFSPETTKSITAQMQGMSAQEKVKFLRGFDLLNAEPSFIGKMFGVTEKEAQQILSDTFGGPIRETSAGALPGYQMNPQAGAINPKGTSVGFGPKGPNKGPIIPSKKPIPGETPQQALARSEAYAKQAHPSTTTLYHGTKVKDFTNFDPKYHPTDDAPAFFFTPDKQNALSYAADVEKGGGSVVHANIDTNKFFNVSQKEWSDGLDYNKLKSEGYTGVKIAPPLESADSFIKGAFGDKPTYAVFDTKNINIKGVQNFDDALNNVPLSKVTPAQLQSQIDFINEQIAQHPGKAIQRFESKKEGQFEELLNPDAINPKTGKFRYTEAQKAKIIARNKKVTKGVENAFSDTKYTGEFDNPDAIREAIAEYRNLKNSRDVLKERLKTIRSLKSDIRTGKPIRLTAKEQAMVGTGTKAVPFMPKAQVIPPTAEGKSIAQTAQQEGYDIPPNYQIPKEIKLGEKVYEQNRNSGGNGDTFKGVSAKYWGSTKEGADKILGVISTRLKNLNPQLKRDIRKLEYNLSTNTEKDLQASIPFMHGNKKIPKNDQMDLDLALKNSDTTKINEIVTRNNLGSELNTVGKVLDDLYKRANAIGYEVPYRKDYFPRQIKDAKAFQEYLEGRSDWNEIDDLIKAKEVELDRYLTAEEKAMLVNLNTNIPPGEKVIFETGSMKPRTIEIVDAELNKFYVDSNTALSNYIQATNDAIESWKFFKTGTTRTKFTKIDDTINTYVLNKVADGTIKPSQVEELTNILHARFKDVGTKGIVSLYKNLAYIDTMGSPISAITQIGDLGFALYRTGPWKTLKETTKSLFGKSEIKRADIGIDKIAIEFSETGSGMKAVSKVFKMIGLDKFDAIGKEAYINAVLNKYRQQARNLPNLLNEKGEVIGKANADFTRRLEAIFGDETSQVIYDLKSGNVTENVKMLAFNELLDIQPIKLSEMPEQYLKGGNGRIFYMLKTYTVKLYDVYRNEVFDTMKRNKAEGIRNLLLLSASLMVANATADEIKDFLLGRKTSLKDRTVDNLLRLAGFTKWTIYQARQEGGATAVVKTILPPFKLLDSIYKDVLGAKNINDMEIIQSIPIVGKFYYYWFGKKAKSEKPKSVEINIPDIKIPEINIPDIKI